jgi:hypothetical protein
MPRRVAADAATMRRAAVLLCSAACVYRVDTTRVTLHDPGELAVVGSGSLPGSGAIGLVDHDVVLVGSAADVLAFDGDELHMHLIDDEVGVRRGRSYKRRVLDLRLDTPLANVKEIRAVGVVANHHVLPLGLLAGGFLTVVGGGVLAVELAEHAQLGTPPPPVFALTAGLAILAVEIHARLARDTVTAVKF